MIVVTGATGNTGRAVAEQLLDAGEDVRVIGRSDARLQPLVAREADPAVGELEDAVFLTAALHGARALYAMIPPDYEEPDYMGRYRRIASVLAQAIDLSGVSHVVLLSSLGGELEAGSGPVLGLHLAEERLKQIPDLNLLVLRSGYFYENMLGSLPLIKHQGVNGGAFDPDVPVPMIAASDIGVVAAAALRTRDFRGIVVRDLYGPRELSMSEVTRIIGQRIGKPDLEYVRFPDEQTIAGITQAGIAEPVARLFVELAQAYNEGRIRGHQPRTAANTGQTTFEAFAGALAEAYTRL